MKKISIEEFIEKYKPIVNNRVPTFNTILPEDHPLNPYIWDIREKTLISEYIQARCFFTMTIDHLLGKMIVIPGTMECSKGYIITKCSWRPENMEYTEV